MGVTGSLEAEAVGVAVSAEAAFFFFFFFFFFSPAFVVSEVRSTLMMPRSRHAASDVEWANQMMKWIMNKEVKDDPS